MAGMEAGDDVTPCSVDPLLTKQPLACLLFDMQKDENHEECRPGDETALGNRDQQGEIFEQSNPRMLPGSLERKFFMRDTTYDSDRHDNKTPETKEQEIRRPGVSRPTQAGQETK